MFPGESRTPGISCIPQKLKSNGVRSGERRGHAISPPRSTHLLPKVPFERPRTTWSKCAGAPSSWNHNRTTDVAESGWLVYLQSPPPVLEALMRKKSLNKFNLYCLLYSVPSLLGVNCLHPPPRHYHINEAFLKIILFTYRRCSIWPPPTSVHFL